MDPEPATLRTTPASVGAVESAGINKLKIYHMENIKQNSTLRAKRLRAAIDYGMRICGSGDEAARGSLPAQRPQRKK